MFFFFYSVLLTQSTGARGPPVPPLRPRHSALGDRRIPAVVDFIRLDSERPRLFAAFVTLSKLTPMETQFPLPAWCLPACLCAVYLEQDRAAAARQASVRPIPSVPSRPVRPSGRPSLIFSSVPLVFFTDPPRVSGARALHSMSLSQAVSEISPSFECLCVIDGRLTESRSGSTSTIM